MPMSIQLHCTHQMNFVGNFNAAPNKLKPNELQTQFKRHYSHVMRICAFSHWGGWCFIISLISRAIAKKNPKNGIELILKFCNQFCLFVLYSRNYDQFIKLLKSLEIENCSILFLLPSNATRTFDTICMYLCGFQSKTFSTVKYKQNKNSPVFKEISIKIAIFFHRAFRNVDCFSCSFSYFSILFQ